MYNDESKSYFNNENVSQTMYDRVYDYANWTDAHCTAYNIILQQSAIKIICCNNITYIIG